MRKSIRIITRFLVTTTLFASIHYCCLAQIKSYKKTSFGISCLLEKGKMNIYLLANDLAEVKYTSLQKIEPKRSLVVLPVSSYLKNFVVADDKNEIIITTTALKIRINKKNNAIIYTDLNDAIILAEAAKAMADTTIAGINTHSCNVSFTSPRDEALFGLGCHPLDSLSINYKGRNQNMAIKYLTGAIPVLLSSKGYGLLFDNYAESKFYGGEHHNTQFTYASESSKLVDYYFFYGPSFDHIIDLYRNITGKAPMYPRWAFGLFQSQDRYKTQQQVLDAAAGYRNNHIPVDVIVQDWFYWYPLPIGSHVMNPDSFPNPKAMIDELHKQNFHAMISIWPCFGKGTNNYNALDKAGYLTDVTWDNFFVHTRDTYYDAHNPGAREMYWAQARDSLIKRYGWDAWWVDQCEPDTEDPNNRKKSNFYTGKGIDYFNTYSLEHTKGIYQKWRRDINGKRIFLLVRQAFAGQQRNAATLWSSDISCSFHDFKDQVPQAINTGSSGIPYWTSDIGGYVDRTVSTGIPDWTNPMMRELFTRWFQFGTFCPIMRIHGRGERAVFSKNWDENTRSILLKYDDLRYRLLPYNYSLSADVTMKNYTMMRSLAFDFRNDTSVYSIPDQYMFGPAFLVNPVTDQFAKTRSVYLPAGAEWFDFWTGKKFKGGQKMAADAPIETIPLYVKTGSIVPMGKRMEYATQQQEDTIELRIYPGADGEFTLYEDADNNYNYEKGEYATFTFKWNDASKRLQISARKGLFPGMLQSRIFNVVVVNENKGIGEKEILQADKVVHYNGEPISIQLP